MIKTLSTATAVIAAALGLANPAGAQLAGFAALGDSAIGRTRVALGASATSTTVGAGGFIGDGGHVVTSPIAQLRTPGARTVIPAATLDLAKTMPRLGCSDDGGDRARFVVSAQKKRDALLPYRSAAAGCVG